MVIECWREKLQWERDVELNLCLVPWELLQQLTRGGASGKSTWLLFGVKLWKTISISTQLLVVTTGKYAACEPPFWEMNHYDDYRCNHGSIAFWLRTAVRRQQTHATFGCDTCQTQVEGIKWLGRSISGIGGMLLYIFISSYNRFKILSVHVNIKNWEVLDRKTRLLTFMRLGEFFMVNNLDGI
jgi:hypothetical protein